MRADSSVAKPDAAAVADYRLPDPLIASDGSRVEDAVRWSARRREVLDLFAREVYGRTPLAEVKGTRVVAVAVEAKALDGLATRTQARIQFGSESAAPVVTVLLYTPNGQAGQRWPVLLGLNFYGNHSVDSDPGIQLPDQWVPDAAPGSVDFHATEAGRGGDASKWQVEMLLRRGYAVATAYCGDFCPDRPDGLSAGINGWLYKTGTEDRPPDAWGAIGVWAWGLSRVVDYLQTHDAVDRARIAVHGHSRLGKAALWAAAQDPRFALAISNESGCGGAALSKRIHGETVAKINAQFPHWFARNFRQYDDREELLPVDQHQLLALIAPRPLYVASAEDDDWADPLGEFLSVQAAAPVYRVLGKDVSGLGSMPAVNHPTGGLLRYHIRTGAHDMMVYDWTQYLDFADRWMRKA